MPVGDGSGGTLIYVVAFAAGALLLVLLATVFDNATEFDDAASGASSAVPELDPAASESPEERESGVEPEGSETVEGTTAPTETPAAVSEAAPVEAPNGDCAVLSESVRAMIGMRPAPGVSIELASGYLLEGKNGTVIGGFLSGSDEKGVVDGQFGSWYIKPDGSIYRYTDAALRLTDWPQIGDGRSTALSRRIKACAEANAG